MKLLIGLLEESYETLLVISQHKAMFSEWWQVKEILHKEWTHYFLASGLDFIIFACCRPLACCFGICVFIMYFSTQCVTCKEELCLSEKGLQGAHSESRRELKKNQLMMREGRLCRWPVHNNTCL